ncbi:MAG: glycosyltransferase family 4 protein [Oscillospiraceae bacterium]|nr:glycosyltransferase family 4 protein [Oscillospiraceae bacterium]
MKIFLVPPPALPVPAVKGGAVETLITHLVEENELQQKAELVCVSIPDPAAQEQARAYRHTKMLYLPRQPLKQKLWGPVCGQLRRMGKPAPLDSWYNQVLEAIRREKPDVVVTEGGNLTETQAISADFGRENCWAHLHMQLGSTPQLEEMYGGILAISRFVAESYRPTRPVKTALVPNCVDVQRFCPQPECPEERTALREKLGFSAEDFVVIFCGRITPEKGIHCLVEAMEQISDPHVKLLVIGSPFFAAESTDLFFEELKRRGEALGDRLRFTGYIPNPQLPAYYRAADAACFPALWDEPAGITAIEAMACGCPIIATNSGGMPEYLAGSGALLLERNIRLADDGTPEEISGAAPLPQSIAQAILELKADPARAAAMAAAGPQRAQAFSRRAYYESFIRALTP